jgi:uncharacterized repeat protein (TIGR03803 family)
LRILTKFKMKTILYHVKTPRLMSAVPVWARHLMFLIFTAATMANYAHAQYVHPNQAGRKGGDNGAGIGSQVVTSTYMGNAGSLLGQGTLMSVNKDGTNAASYYDFKGFPGDGSYPFYTTPFHATDGKLYGTTFIGGSSNWGSVYSYDFSNCSEFVVYNSGPGPSGGSAAEFANVNELSDGKLYFPETYGGSSNLGAIYRMDKDGSNRELVHDFKYNIAPQPAYSISASAQALTEGLATAHYDGAYPYGFVVEGADGKIYGSTFAGGAMNWGSWWRCNKDGSGYEVIRLGSAAVLPYLSGTNVPVSAYHISNPMGNIAQDQSGLLYITGNSGGAGGVGGVGRMNPDGSAYQLLVSGSAANGYNPYRGAVIIDDKVYGTMRLGGGTPGAAGVVYSMNLNGTAYTKMKIFDDAGDGSQPWASLSYDGTHLFGTNIVGGGAGAIGTIFKIKPDGTDYQRIHTFLSTAVATTGACAGTNKTGLFAWYPSAERVTFADVKLSCSATCVANPVACTAPGTAPSLTAQSISNQCPLTSADLTTLNAEQSVSWHTAVPALTSNRVAEPDRVGAGTYYAAYYDQANDCYSSVSSAAVTVSIGYCNPYISLTANNFQFTTQINTQHSGNTSSDSSPQGVGPFSYQSVDCGSGNASGVSAQGGSISISANGSYIYQPATGFTGVDTFCVRICNGSSPAACKVVNYTVFVTPEDCEALGSVPAN